MTGDELREIRRSLGMNQTELSGKLGVQRETVSRMERGVSPVSKRTRVAVEALVAETPPAG